MDVILLLEIEDKLSELNGNLSSKIDSINTNTNTVNSNVSAIKTTVDNIYSKINNLDNRLTATRAGYLDKLNSGVPVSSLTGKIVKSIQRGTVIIEIGETEATAMISRVDVNKAIVVFSGSSIERFSGGNDYLVISAMARLTLESDTQIKAVRYFGSGKTTVPYQVIEFY